MSSSFRLPNGQFASYGWTSLLIRLGSLKIMRKSLVLETIASLHKNRANWKSGGELRGAISLLHELTHLGQDLFSGAGAHDYLVLREALPGLLNWARAKSISKKRGTTFGFGPNYAVTQQCSSQLLLDCFAGGDEHRDARLLRALQRINSTTTMEDTVPFRFRNLLEADSVAATWLNLRDVRGSVDQMDILKERPHLAMFEPQAMPEDYRIVFQLVFDHFEYLFGRRVEYWVERFGRDRVITLAARCTRVLVDLSLAVPTQRLVQTRHLDWEEYLPGVRFARCLNAWIALPPDETLQLGEFILSYRSSEEIEACLAPCMAYPYLAQREIYEDWVDVLTEMDETSRDEDNYLLRVRARACEYRFSQDEGWWSPDPIIMLWSNVPVFLLTVDDMHNFHSGVTALDEDEQFKMFVDIQRYNRDLRVVEWLLHEEPYFCARAESHTCSAANKDCSGGIRLGTQFPAVPGCSVREGLEASGFAL